MLPARPLVLQPMQQCPLITCGHYPSSVLRAPTQESDPSRCILPLGVCGTTGGWLLQLTAGSPCLMGPGSSSGSLRCGEGELNCVTQALLTVLLGTVFRSKSSSTSPSHTNADALMHNCWFPACRPFKGGERKPPSFYLGKAARLILSAPPRVAAFSEITATGQQLDPSLGVNCSS